VSLQIDDPEVQRLAEALARTTGETPTEAIRRALLERWDRLRFRVPDTSRAEQVRRCLESGFSPPARELPVGRAEHVPERYGTP